MTAIDISKLTREEKLRLLDELWESLSHDEEEAPLTEAERAALDRRLEVIDADPSPGLPWDEVKRRILDRSL